MKEKIIQYKVLELIAEAGIISLTDKPISENTVLATDTDCDSLDFVEFTMHCEKEFSIDMPTEEVKKFYSLPIKNITEYICVHDARVSKNAMISFQQKQSEIAARKTFTKPEQKTTVMPTEPKAAAKTKSIELIQKNNSVIEFRQNGKVINLDHPQISQLISEMKNRLQGLEK